MNYLAHLVVAGPSSDSIIGNLLGDFVKGPLNELYSEKITEGIRLHRKVDTFSDAHAVTRHSRNLFSRERRRFAGIIVDVCYDHFLSRHWEKYHDDPRPEFISKVYDTLLVNQKLLPDRLQEILPRMIGQDWLGSYHRLSGIEAALNGISYRFKRRNKLLGSISEVNRNYHRLEKDFLIFFPELIKFSKNEKRLISSKKNQNGKENCMSSSGG